MTRPLWLLQGGSARYGASTYPFDPRKGGSLAPIRWDDEAGAVGGMMEENEGVQHDSCSRRDSCSRHKSSSSNSSGYSSRKLSDGIWHGAPTFLFDPGKMAPVLLPVTNAEGKGMLMDSIRFVVLMSFGGDTDMDIFI